MKNPESIKKIKQYVTAHFAEANHAGLLYHNLDHTLGVAKHAREIAEYYKLPETEIWLLETAALFHDTGVTVTMTDHEAISVGIMRDYFADKIISEELLVQLSGLIEATRIPQKPVGLLQEIICDADLFNLGRKSLFQKSELLRKEREILQQKSISNEEWLQDTLQFLLDHQYHTSFALTELNPGKKKNISQINDELKSYAPKNKHLTIEEPAHEHDHEKEKPEKGIETMFRITSSNNQRLSDMADNKAHIMITVNSIILSALISLLLRRLDAYAFLAYPTFLLLAVSLGAMTFAILATRPSIPHGGGLHLQNQDLEKTNLLFFGNFYRMQFEDYKSGMMKIMDDKDLLYSTLIRDVYGQGAVLGKKYRLLRVSYNIFMYGLILSVIAFIVVSAFHSNPVVPAVPAGTPKALNL